MLRRTIKLALAAGVLAAAVTAGFAFAGTSKHHDLPTVTLMVGGIDKQIYLPYQLAQDLGYYKKYGVNVQLSTEQEGGVGAEDAIASGSVNMAGAWYVHAIDFQQHGKDIIDVVQLSGAPGEREMCAAGSKFVAAMQQGRITCGMTTQPTVTAIEKQGIGYSAIDLASVAGVKKYLGGPLPTASVLAYRSWANANKATVQKVVDALVATMHWIN